DARTLARMRAGVEGCSVLYVSSAPSAETWFYFLKFLKEQARKEKWQKVTCEAEHLSAMQIVDMTNYNPQKTSILSFPLQNAIRDTLAQQGKVVLLMNRKGFTTRTHCQQCGFTVKCDRCNVNLTYLYSQKAMVCRHCNFRTELPKVCPQCHGGYLRSSGTGTEKLESEVARLYPQARVGRFDTSSKSFPRQADVVITTKAVLREQGAMDASLVGVINFDAELHHLDFRSGHHAFALLVRLRQLAAQKLLVQTRMMDNYVLRAVSRNDFDGFYKKELELRKELGFPPYRHLVAICLRGVNEEFVFEQAKELSARLEKDRDAKVEISDPHPDVNPKLRDKYRFTILLKGRSVKSILAFIRKALKDFSRKRNTIVTINVDP
ncbi:MAG: primosomal protein N', partial [Candidatus Omnitrophica bacterium]|nr:primosomal protein N' [Candidatus Omnitrophota bacterium]